MPAPLLRNKLTLLDDALGQVLELTVGPVAHGGFCVARHEGRVVFVRFALPGEQVRAVVTQGGKRFWRADAVELLGNRHPDRVASTWPQTCPDIAQPASTQGGQGGQALAGGLTAGNAAVGHAALSNAAVGQEGRGADVVGGGELAHVSVEGQLRWKRAVIVEQMSRLAGLDLDVSLPAFTVEPAKQEDRVQSNLVPDNQAQQGFGNQDMEGQPSGLHSAASQASGLHYRTRISLTADSQGYAGMRQARSHSVTRLSTMPLATEQVLDLAQANEVFSRKWRPGQQLDLVAPANGSPGLLLVDGQPWHRGRPDSRPNARTSVRESVSLHSPYGDLSHDFKLAGQGFWQVHRHAPALLTQAVLDSVSASTTEPIRLALDLYSGAGLFTAFLAQALGSAGQVISVEGDERAVKDARRNLHHLGSRVHLRQGPVDQVLADLADLTPDLVVLDPPRAGAGRKVMELIAGMGPATLVYVACDPAALARDISYATGLGYRLQALRAFDIFPMTHHVECVATLKRESA